MLRIASSTVPAPASQQRRCVVASASQQQSRRQVLGGAVCGVALLSALVPVGPATAYGGAKELRALDEGSGNPTYDALMKDVRARQAAAGAADPFAEASKKLEESSKANKAPSGKRGSR
ncbi:hypothetical protein FOA52_010404 [Chlamydomonas sp. UWO 241]|nr:hypothetical protein FOA52_010404 [Chlamydomonas sp. UWO 241]